MMRPNKCKKCGKRFEHRWQLATHHRVVHPKPKEDLPVESSLPVEASLPQGANGGVKVQYFKVNYCPHCGVHLDKIDLY